MKVALISVALAAALTGCVVAPVGPAYGYDSSVVYPTYSSAYIWDPALSIWYFNGPRGRYNMDRGWRYGQGYHGGGWHNGRGRHR